MKSTVRAAWAGIIGLILWVQQLTFVVFGVAGNRSARWRLAQRILVLGVLFPARIALSHRLLRGAPVATRQEQRS